MKSKRSSLPLIAGVVVLAAVGGTAAYMFANRPGWLDSAVDGIFKSDGPEAPAGKAAGKEQTRPAEKAAAADKAGVEPRADDGRAAKPAAEPADVSRLEAMLGKALACYADLDYEKARTLLADLLSGPLPADLKARAERLERASAVFACVLDGIAPLELSDYRNLVEVRLQNGNSIIGRIVSEAQSKIVVMQDYGIKANLRRDEIDRIAPCPPDRMKGIKETEFDKFRNSPEIGKGDAVSCFLQAEFCIRNGLRDKVNALLEKGLESDRMFETIVYNEKGKRIYRQYLYFKGKKMESMAKRAYDSIQEKFPDSYFAKQARSDEQEATVMAPPKKAPAPKPPGPDKPAPEKPPAAPAAAEDDWGDDAEDEPETPAPASPPGSKGGAIETARKLIREARAREEAAAPGRPGADAEVVKALAAYEKAAEALEKALKTNPEHADWIESQIEEVQSAIYWLRKQSKLS